MLWVTFWLPVFNISLSFNDFSKHGFDSGLLLLLRKLQVVMGERLLATPPDHLRLQSLLKTFGKPRLRLIRLATDS